MADGFEGIKVLLDAHLGNLRNELSRLNSNYESIRSEVHNLSSVTGIAIAEIKKDIQGLITDTKNINDELGAVKKRIEINEDSQAARWLEQGTRWTEYDINRKSQEKKSNIIIGLLVGAIGTVIALIVTSIFKIVWPF